MLNALNALLFIKWVVYVLPGLFNVSAFVTLLVNYNYSRSYPDVDQACL